MSKLRRIYGKMIGCVEEKTAIVEIIGTPGVTPGAFYPPACVRISTDLIPMHRRFPNSTVWFDVKEDRYVYVEPDNHSDE